jgi:hypothetical protein
VSNSPATRRQVARRSPRSWKGTCCWRCSPPLGFPLHDTGIQYSMYIASMHTPSVYLFRKICTPRFLLVRCRDTSYGHGMYVSFRDRILYVSFRDTYRFLQYIHTPPCTIHAVYLNGVSYREGRGFIHTRLRKVHTVHYMAHLIYTQPSL